jgi:uncharacterized protein (TIGR02145 family)
MTTIYTVNNKVLKNNVTDKWLIKKAAPGPVFDEVTIGTQTWMSKNLAIDDGQGGIAIRDNVTANGVNFGTQYYYTWDAAVRVANSITGWHLPTKDEWETLVSYAGGNNEAVQKLRSTTGWDNNLNGTDDYGFSAIPVGYVWEGSGLYYAGSQTYLWSSTEDSDNTKAFCTLIGYDDVFMRWTVNTASVLDKNQGVLSVRLIKDS